MVEGDNFYFRYTYLFFGAIPVLEIFLGFGRVNYSCQQIFYVQVSIILNKHLFSYNPVAFISRFLEYDKKTYKNWNVTYWFLQVFYGTFIQNVLQVFGHRNTEVTFCVCDKGPTPHFHQTEALNKTYSVKCGHCCRIIPLLTGSSVW